MSEITNFYNNQKINNQTARQDYFTDTVKVKKSSERYKSILNELNENLAKLNNANANEHIALLTEKDGSKILTRYIYNPKDKSLKVRKIIYTENQNEKVIKSVEHYHFAGESLKVGKLNDSTPKATSIVDFEIIPEETTAASQPSAPQSSSTVIKFDMAKETLEALAVLFKSGSAASAAATVNTGTIAPASVPGSTSGTPTSGSTATEVPTPGIEKSEKAGGDEEKSEAPAPQTFTYKQKIFGPEGGLIDKEFKVTAPSYFKQKKVTNHMAEEVGVYAYDPERPLVGFYDAQNSIQGSSNQELANNFIKALYPPSSAIPEYAGYNAWLGFKISGFPKNISINKILTKKPVTKSGNKNGYADNREAFFYTVTDKDTGKKYTMIALTRVLNNAFNPPITQVKVFMVPETNNISNLISKEEESFIDLFASCLRSKDNADDTRTDIEKGLELLTKGVGKDTKAAIEKTAKETREAEAAKAAKAKPAEKK